MNKEVRCPNCRKLLFKIKEGNWLSGITTKCTRCKSLVYVVNSTGVVENKREVENSVL